MKISEKININVPETVENAISGREDFHFYVDELTSNGYMPTYAGRADEKYSFESMDDSFFEFLDEKIAENGIYIRLILATGEMIPEGARFTLECGKNESTFITDDVSNLLVFEFADFGIRVCRGEVTLGTTVDGGCGHAPRVVSGNEPRGALQQELRMPLRGEYYSKLINGQRKTRTCLTSKLS